MTSHLCCRWSLQSHKLLTILVGCRTQGLDGTTVVLWQNCYHNGSYDDCDDDDDVNGNGGGGDYLDDIKS